MYTRLAIALDGSAQAEKALPVALQLAKTLSASLLLLHLCMEPEDREDSPKHRDNLEAGFKPEPYLAELKAKLTDPAKSWALRPDRVQTKIYYSKFAYELGEVATTEGADLLLMTTHGRSGLSLLVLGSIATGVLKHTRQPVLLLRPSETSATLDEALEAATQAPGQILLTLDESSGAEAALEPAVRLAEQLGVTLHLVQVITPAPPIIMVEPGMDYRLLAEISQSQEEALTKDAFQYLSNVEKWAREKAPGLKVARTVLNGYPAPQLVAYLGEIKPFLVVMATHARNEFGQILLGSVAEEVLRESHLPALLVPIPKGFAGYELQPDKVAEKARTKKPEPAANK